MASGLQLCRATVRRVGPLRLITPDQRWRVYASQRRPGFDLVEVWPDRHMQVHLEDATLVEVVAAMERLGVDPLTLVKA